jgi:oxygen-dependent protoporphyrinogen oxidase
MIGNLDPSEKQATIIGAGISGLLIAYALKKNGFTVKVLEASARAGGLIGTEMTAYGIAEKAAHSLLVTPEAKKIFAELKVELVPVQKDSRARFIYRNKKMRKMPLSLWEIICTLIRFFSKPKKIFPIASGSLEEWGNTYLGKSATQYLLAPFITGIFATSPRLLLAKLAFPKLVPSQPYLSLFRHFRTFSKSPRPVMMTPRIGMSELVSALTRELHDEISYDHPVSQLPSDPNLILTVPSAALAKLLTKTDPHSAEDLLRVQYAPLISITCFFKSEAFKKPPKGIGVLVPRGEGLRLLGCLFNSSAFPNRVLNPDHHSFTVMYGGTEDSEALQLSDEELTALLNSELKILLQTREPALSLTITRWNRAIPIYSTDLKKAHDSLKTGFCSISGQIIFNNFSKEVSIRSLINATLHF